MNIRSWLRGHVALPMLLGHPEASQVHAQGGAPSKQGYNLTRPCVPEGRGCEFCSPLNPQLQAQAWGIVAAQ